VKRLAVPVEDHELAAGDFEGVHLGASRGSGAVIIWDEGTYEMLRDEPNHLAFSLSGTKLKGGFAITKTGDHRWILVKMNDDHARRGSDVVAEEALSARTGRSWRELADSGD
jgi:ATP-dependent DNA ligase